MKQLASNWLTESHIDFEYKKYMLLAYLQDVSKHFDQAFLYPGMTDLVMHYRNLIHLRDSRQHLLEQFPERIASTDMENFKIIFKKIVEDDQLMQELVNIIDFSIPEFEKHLQEGKRIYEFVEAHLNIQPVGVMPLNAGEGYILLRNGPKTETRVFEYQISFFENPRDRYRSIVTQHLADFKYNISNSYENIKTELLRTYRKLPNPATYLIESDMCFPLTESLIPVAKRSFVKYLASNKAC